MTDYTAQLKTLAASQNDTVARHMLPDGKAVWIRKAGRHNAAWRYRLLGLVVKVLHLGVLTPVPNLGGTAAIAIEAARLHELSAAGIYVPELLAQQENALMMSELDGQTLLDHITREAEQKKLDSWLAGVHAIAEVHRKKQFLSQAFARNIMSDGERIGFIDFEDNPFTVLTLEQCQSRDWLCYLHSTVLVLQRNGLLPEAVELLKECLQQQPQNIQTLVKQTIRPILWMRVLQNRRWGRDTLQLSALAGLFYLFDL